MGVYSLPRTTASWLRTEDMHNHSPNRHAAGKRQANTWSAAGGHERHASVQDVAANHWVCSCCHAPKTSWPAANPGQAGYD
jgi:hypothetical protein